jgi:hypothetical protein
MISRSEGHGIGEIPEPFPFEFLEGKPAAADDA